MVSSKKEKLIRLLKKYEIVRRENVTLKNAGGSSFYVDIKKAFGYPEILKIMTELIFQKVDAKVDCIASGGYGGLPLAGAVASKYSLKLALVREKPKNHGRNTWIDGYVPQKGEKVWIIDDVFSTGGSIKEMVGIIKKTGAKVLGASVVVRRSNKKITPICNSVLVLDDII
jgi:orotate phosphoribosyltransferase